MSLCIQTFKEAFIYISLNISGLVILAYFLSVCYCKGIRVVIIPVVCHAPVEADRIYDDCIPGSGV